jgi:hypothetical protein
VGKGQIASSWHNNGTARASVGAGCFFFGWLVIGWGSKVRPDVILVDLVDQHWDLPNNGGTFVIFSSSDFHGGRWRFSVWLWLAWGLCSWSASGLTRDYIEFFVLFVYLILTIKIAWCWWRSNCRPQIHCSCFSAQSRLDNKMGNCGNLDPIIEIVRNGLQKQLTIGSASQFCSFCCKKEAGLNVF